jgi:hypothetical protein
MAETYEVIVDGSKDSEKIVRITNTVEVKNDISVAQIIQRIQDRNESIVQMQNANAIDQKLLDAIVSNLKLDIPVDATAVAVDVIP